MADASGPLATPAPPPLTSSIQSGTGPHLNSLPEGEGAARLAAPLTRRRLLRTAGTATAALLLAAHLPAGSSRAGGEVGDDGSRLLGYAFGSANGDVTIFDATTLQPLETRPLGARVRWLDQANHFWDGRYVWTYDEIGPQLLVEALAVEPHEVSVARRIPTGARGPSWGVELLADGRTAWMAMAGDDVVTILDLEAGEVVEQLGVGDYP